MTRAGLVWDVSIDMLATGVKQKVRDVPSSVFNVLLSYEEDVTSWMKRNAPWTDRTGRARASLAAKASLLGDTAVLELLYDDPGVYYSVYLEYYMSGRWAILGPALDFWYPKVLNAVRQAIKGSRLRAASRGRKETAL